MAVFGGVEGVWYKMFLVHKARLCKMFRVQQVFGVKGFLYKRLGFLAVAVVCWCLIVFDSV